jgi:hypothetical protein
MPIIANINNNIIYICVICVLIDFKDSLLAFEDTVYTVAERASPLLMPLMYTAVGYGLIFTIYTVV